MSMFTDTKPDLGDDQWSLAAKQLQQQNAGGGSGGASDYVTKTANYTAVDKDQILADTSGGAFTITLPASPSVGNYVVITSPGASWQTNNLTVGRNGQLIDGAAANSVQAATSVTLTFIFVGGLTGWKTVRLAITDPTSTLLLQGDGAGGVAYNYDPATFLTSPTDTTATPSFNSSAAVPGGKGCLVIATVSITVGAGDAGRVDAMVNGASHAAFQAQGDSADLTADAWIGTLTVFVPAGQTFGLNTANVAGNPSFALIGNVHQWAF